MATYPDSAAMPQPQPQQQQFAVDPNMQYPMPNMSAAQNTSLAFQDHRISTDQPRQIQHDPQKARLRKACDGCSLRKVKCDENTPCKPCHDLGIECRFERPSKRRGPPNRHAEALKRQKMDSGLPGQAGSSSPTHAAQALASFAQTPFYKQNMETIAPLPIVEALIQDYFTYIHPLIPIPHEPSFREALSTREDNTNPTFLALLTSMVGCVVAGFPARLRQHHRTHNIGGSLDPVDCVQRCHAIIVQAREPNYLDREFSVHDAAISYLVGMTGVYTRNWHKARVYLEQCLTITRLLGIHKASGPDYINADGSPSLPPSTNGHDLSDQHVPPNAVFVELGKRVYWLVFIAVKTLQQLGVPSEELNILPASKAKPYPSLPVEVDDASVTHTRLFDQPEGVAPELSGFNADVRLHLSYNKFSIIESSEYVDEVLVSDVQRRLIKQSLHSVSQTAQDAVSNLSLKIEQAVEGAPQQPSYPSPVQGMPGSRPEDAFRHNQYYYIQHRRVQLEVQKINILANALSSRSYLIEKYYKIEHVSSSSTGTTSSPTPLPHDIMDEREDLVTDFVALLNTIHSYKMEFTAAGFIQKLQHLANTLVEAPSSQKGPVALHAERYLHAFIQLAQGLEHRTLAGPHHLSAEEDEAAQAHHWAEFQSQQSRFTEAAAGAPPPTPAPPAGVAANDV